MREADVLETMRGTPQEKTLKQICTATLRDIRVAMTKNEKSIVISLIDYLDIIPEEVRQIEGKYNHLFRSTKTKNSDIAPYDVSARALSYRKAIEKFRALRKLISRKGVVQW